MGDTPASDVLEELSSILDDIDLSSRSQNKNEPLEKWFAHQIDRRKSKIGSAYVSANKQLPNRLGQKGPTENQIALLILADEISLDSVVEKIGKKQTGDGSFADIAVLIYENEGEWTVPRVIYKSTSNSVDSIRDLFPGAKFEQAEPSADEDTTRDLFDGGSGENTPEWAQKENGSYGESGEQWTETENKSLVSAYLDILEAGMAGEDVVKARVNRKLRDGPLPDRSESAVEYKMQNLSSVLEDRNLPWIDGYKPRGNSQQSLESEAVEQTQQKRLVEKAIEWSFRDFRDALSDAGLVFDDDFIRAFITSLATKRFTILTGLSGSGKTQIALKFGEWLGEDQYKVVPVRPDWTDSEALFGYEDALLPASQDDRRAWHVPEPLEFMLEASRDPWTPYVIILDEMNLAHVERYFADVLSGMESGEACLPNLARDEEDGLWRIPEDADSRKIPFPDNLFVVGTVNVDETTYTFSPKVLDRANTLEFRVGTDELKGDLTRPEACDSGPIDLTRGLLQVSRNYEWTESNPHRSKDEFVDQFKTVHRLLAEGGFEFGHRVFYEALRFASLLDASGAHDVRDALDLQILQKVLPRLHGSRRRLEPTLVALARFCHNLEFDEGTVRQGEIHEFNPLEEHDDEPELPRAYEKLQRMTRTLRANQFVSFTE